MIDIKNIKICVIGLGYVGLPIALEFSKKFSVIGFDVRKRELSLEKVLTCEALWKKLKMPLA